MPRWVRVNTLKMTFDDFAKRLQSMSLVSVDGVQALKDNPNGYLVDKNVKNLLALHPTYPVMTKFSTEYTSGTIILQDKASCIPADLLDVKLGSSVLDACAAPGNKTTQLSAATTP